ncbi:MAG: TIGR03986 family CRISPR-associated RAMP protein [Sphingobacteriia bacterium]|nr:TIGR03986 family CRISPR-associated RAMP protein [Sphingobacteriia bacterium]
MVLMKAPFNFVPLNQHVYYPDWAEQVSQDIPFSDGLSGQIELTIEAESPIYIRNGFSVNELKSENKSGDFVSNSFWNFNGQYFIPGSSLKGMIRNIFEIISFSKMPTDPRMRFARRDMLANNRSNIYPLKNITEQKEIRCGWLSMNDNSYVIKDCGHPYRISHKELDKIFGSELFENHFSKVKGKDLSKPIDRLNPKMAKFKYKLIEKNGLSKYLKGSFVKDEANRKATYEDGKGSRGEIVFTGQPDRWDFPRNKDSKGKFNEFVIFEDELGSDYKISREVFNQYNFFMDDSEDWLYCLSKIKEGNRYPVFFRFESEESEEAKKVKDFGLAFMYRLPYIKGVSQLVDEFQEPNGIDLAEAVFGFTELKKVKLERNKKVVEKINGSLKSRVHFGHAFAEANSITLADQITGCLAGPKASYYPIYIRQREVDPDKGKYYQTYDNGVISGWKRYPLKESVQLLPKIGDKMDTTFVPVEKGAKFSGKITFHNLRPIELGCLLSAITFHNNPEYRHSLGMAKPYGYGKVKIESKLKVFDENSLDIDGYLVAFEKKMNEFLATKRLGKWFSTEQIEELFAMADPKRVNKENSDQLNYLNLGGGNAGANEFLKIKKQNDFLHPFTSVFKGGTSRVSPLDSYLAREKANQEKMEEEAREAEKRMIEEQEMQRKLAEQDRLDNKKQEYLEQGLALFLNSPSFSRFLDKCDDYKKKLQLEVIPEDQHGIIIQVIESFNKTDKEFLKETRKGGFEKGRSWLRLQKLIGEKPAYKMFQLISNP